jgi:bifunctional non-homologous end joining protein LigD
VHDVILDGEATGAWGSQGQADYHVFDILWLNGRDVTNLPLDDRRDVLATPPLALPSRRSRRSPTRRCGIARALKAGKALHAKRRDSTYEHKRSKAWLKMKCEITADLVVGGFTDPQGGRVGLARALLVGLS